MQIEELVLTLVAIALVASEAADQVLAAAAMEEDRGEPRRAGGGEPRLAGEGERRRGGEPRRGGAITRCKNTYIEVINIWDSKTTTVERINFKCKHFRFLTYCSIRLNIVFCISSVPSTFNFFHNK